MKSILDRDIVLVVNRNWQVINVVTVQSALGMLVADAATAFDVTVDHDFIPTRWADWHELPVRDADDFVSTPKKKIRVPRVIMAVNFAGVVKRSTKLNMRNLRRHYGDRCAITGRKLKPNECSKEHVVPRSKGGRDSWGNVVLAHRETNSKRGNRSYKEAGLSAPTILPAPKEVLFANTVENKHGFPEWEFFLGKSKSKN